MDIVEVSPPYIGPALPPGTDIWGVTRRDVSYGSGSYNEISHYPLAGEWTPARLSEHAWPDPAWFDYESLPAVIASGPGALADSCIMVTNGNIFETSWYMRGFEQMLMDVMTDEELVHAIMGRVTDFYVAFFSRILEAAPGQIDLVFTADDIGDQRGPLMPLERWERLLKPYHRRLNDAIHERGAKVIYHTDGSIMDAVAGLVDMGIDVLQALQFSADNMDPVRSEDRHGEQAVLRGRRERADHAAVRQPRRRCAAEVEERIEVLGRGGGLHPGPFALDPGGHPAGNIAGLFDTALSLLPVLIRPPGGRPVCALFRVSSHFTAAGL